LARQAAARGGRFTLAKPIGESPIGLAAEGKMAWRGSTIDPTADSAAEAVLDAGLSRDGDGCSKPIDSRAQLAFRSPRCPILRV